MSLDSPDKATVAAKAGHFLDVNTGAVVPEIQLSTTFARDDRYQLIDPANTYARDESPSFVYRYQPRCPGCQLTRKISCSRYRQPHSTPSIK